MKALEILKAIKEQEDTHLWLDDGSGYPKKYIIEAIKELEDFLSRNCSNCKFVGYFSPHESLECQNQDCNFYGTDVDIFTSCNKWEVI